MAGWFDEHVLSVRFVQQFLALYRKNCKHLPEVGGGCGWVVVG